jgi:hypothetical protein
MTNQELKEIRAQLAGVNRMLDALRHEGQEESTAYKVYLDDKKRLEQQIAEMAGEIQ